MHRHMLMNVSRTGLHIRATSSDPLILSVFTHKTNIEVTQKGVPTPFCFFAAFWLHSAIVLSSLCLEPKSPAVKGCTSRLVFCLFFFLFKRHDGKIIFGGK